MYGSSIGRLDFDAVDFFRPLGTGSVDSFFGRRVGIRSDLYSFHITWIYGFCLAFSVRYLYECFLFSCLLCYFDVIGVPINSCIFMGVVLFLCKYFN